jgi:ABC-type glycerol-3-phosphate transport system substrate-binding protein
MNFLRNAVFILPFLLGSVVSHAVAQPPAKLWAEAIVNAEKEGSVVINIPAGNALHDFLQREWTTTFPRIKIEINAIDEGTWAQRIQIERNSGKNLWDVSMSGSVTAFAMKNGGFVIAIVPELILDDVKDPQVWGGWDRVFIDNEHRYVMATQNFLKMPFYNAKLLSPGKVKTDGTKIFLDPSLKGKIVWNDPLLPGSGETFAPVMRDLLGDSGLRTFVTEQSVFVANMMDMVDKMARGQYAISLGPVMNAMLQRYKDAGLDLDIRPLGNTPAFAAYSNFGGSNLIMMKNSPHPSGGKLFVNWMLSKEVALGLAKAQNQDSNRIDIPSVLSPELRPVVGVAYIEPQRESSVNDLRDSHEFIKQIRSDIRR